MKDAVFYIHGKGGRLRSRKRSLSGAVPGVRGHGGGLSVLYSMGNRGGDPRSISPETMHHIGGVGADGRGVCFQRSGCRTSPVKLFFRGGICSKTVIIDHVITSARIYRALNHAVDGFSMKTVLVCCDVETLRRREAQRGDRCAGSAEASLQYLYPKTGYDLSVDSSEASSAALAEKIVRSLTPH